MRNMRWLALLSLSFWLFACPKIEDCANQKDDDGDGAIDCEDSDCQNVQACPQPEQGNCADGVDNDGDLTVDCNDTDCLSDPVCQVAECGNGNQETGEQCDGNDLNNQSCTNFGFSGGVLSCDVACFFDTTGCNNNGPQCGNGIQEAGEQCDNGINNGAPGNPCASNCTLVGNPCGNGTIDNGEACDGTNLNGEDCDSATNGQLPNGTLSCNANCSFNTTQCTPNNGPSCGDGNVDAGEQCDGNNLNNQSCASLNLPGNNLSCNGNCTFNTSGCVDPNADACASPTAIANPSTTQGTTNGASPSQVGSCDTSNDTSIGQDVAFALTSAQAATIQATLTSAADLILYARSTCGSANTELDCADNAGTNGTENITFAIAANQTIFLLVDGFNGDSGNFTLVISSQGGGNEDCTNAIDDDNDNLVDCNDTADCQQACADSCSAPPAVTLGAVISGNTLGHANSRFTNNCTGPNNTNLSAGQNAPDVAYVVTIPQNGQFTATLTADADMSVQARTGACSGANVTQVACVDQQAGGTDETFTITVQAGQLFIIVDGCNVQNGCQDAQGGNTVAGPYTLTLVLQ